MLSCQGGITNLAYRCLGMRTVMGTYRECYLCQEARRIWQTAGLYGRPCSAHMDRRTGDEGQKRTGFSSPSPSSLFAGRTTCRAPYATRDPRARVRMVRIRASMHSCIRSAPVIPIIRKCVAPQRRRRLAFDFSEHREEPRLPRQCCAPRTIVRPVCKPSANQREEVGAAISITTVSPVRRGLVTRGVVSSRGAPAGACGAEENGRDAPMAIAKPGLCRVSTSC